MKLPQSRRTQPWQLRYRIARQIPTPDRVRRDLKLIYEMER